MNSGFSWRRRAVLAVAVRRALTLGCGVAAAGTASRAGATRPAPTLRIVGPWELTGLDPARSGYLFARMQVVETLTDADDAGRPLPGLAAGWTTSADGLEWRFRLRRGARFHDGTPVTGTQVAWVLERARRQPGPLHSAPVESVAATGDDGVTIRLATRFASLPSTLAHSSNQILARSAFAADGSVTAVVGSGPYRIVAVEPPQSFTVVRAFSADPPQLMAVEQASYLSVSRPETRALLAESRQADVAFGLDPASLQRLRGRSGVRVLSVTIPRSVILKLNAGHPWLADVRARQAISLAIDRGGIARGLLRDPALAAGQLFPPTLADWHDPALPPLRTDAAASRALLAAIGWTPGADGILTRRTSTGAVERFSLTLRSFFDRPELPLLAAAVQEQLRQVGIEIKVEIGNSSDIPLGHRQGTLQIGLAARNYATLPDPLGTLLQDFAPAGGDWGAMNWSSAEVTAALRGLSATSNDDPAVDRAARHRVARVLQAELPVVPVAWYRQTAALSPRVDGVSIDPLERSYRLTDMRWNRDGFFFKVR